MRNSEIKERLCNRYFIDNQLTTVNSFPDAFLNALVHLVFLGLRFFLKFLMHLDLQNLNVYIHLKRHRNTKNSRFNLRQKHNLNCIWTDRPVKSFLSRGLKGVWDYGIAKFDRGENLKHSSITFVDNYKRSIFINLNVIIGIQGVL